MAAEAKGTRDRAPLAVERWASQEAARRELSGSHKIDGFKQGVQAAYEALRAAQRRKKLVFTPGHEQDIWDEVL